MDLIAKLIVAGTVFTATTPDALAPQQQAEIDLEKVDTMTTGTLQHTDRKSWEIRRSIYERCTECAQTQPFPEGDLLDE
ncbi:MAG: hypothetical protein AAFV19_25540 [Pseudomonadota bacterium]